MNIREELNLLVLELSEHVPASSLPKETKTELLELLSLTARQIKENTLSQASLTTLLPVLIDATTRTESEKKFLLSLTRYWLDGSDDTSSSNRRDVSIVASLLEPLSRVPDYFGVAGKKIAFSTIPALVRATNLDEQTQELVLFIAGCWLAVKEGTEVLPADLLIDKQLVRLVFLLATSAIPNVVLGLIGILC